MLDLTYPINACDGYLPSLRIAHGGALMSASLASPPIYPKCSVNSSGLSSATAPFSYDLHFSPTFTSPLLRQYVACPLIHTLHPAPHL